MTKRRSDVLQSATSLETRTETEIEHTGHLQKQSVDYIQVDNKSSQMVVSAITYNHATLFDSILHQTGLADIDNENTYPNLRWTKDITEVEYTLPHSQRTIAKLLITHVIRYGTSWNILISSGSLHFRATFSKYRKSLMAAPLKQRPKHRSNDHNWRGQVKKRPNSLAQFAFREPNCIIVSNCTRVFIPSELAKLNVFMYLIFRQPYRSECVNTEESINI